VLTGPRGGIDRDHVRPCETGPGRLVGTLERLVTPPTAARTVSTVSASANTMRAPESAIIRTSSPVALRGLTGTATSRARSAPR
jgi:hypothetical protein